jgi:hypothetical protein
MKLFPDFARFWEANHSQNEKAVCVRFRLLQKMIGCFWYLYLNNSFNLLIDTLATMKMKSTSTCLRSQPLLDIPFLWPIVELVLGNHTGKPYGCGCKRLLEHKAYKTYHSCVDKDPAIAYNKIRVSCWGNGKCVLYAVMWLVITV